MQEQSVRFPNRLDVVREKSRGAAVRPPYAPAAS